MIRLTVLYNLPEGTAEAEFLRWRLGEHQAENAAMPGVIHTDFGRIDERWTFDNPKEKPPYRFMTIAEWPDRASFGSRLLRRLAGRRSQPDVRIRLPHQRNPHLDRQHPARPELA